MTLALPEPPPDDPAELEPPQPATPSAAVSASAVAPRSPARPIPIRILRLLVLGFIEDNSTALRAGRFEFPQHGIAIDQPCPALGVEEVEVGGVERQLNSVTGPRHHVAREARDHEMVVDLDGGEHLAAGVLDHVDHALQAPGVGRSGDVRRRAQVQRAQARANRRARGRPTSSARVCTGDRATLAPSMVRQSSPMVASSTFIFGEPMNVATNVLAGFSYRPDGVSTLHDVAVLEHRDAVAHGHRLDLVVGDVDRGRVGRAACAGG